MNISTIIHIHYMLQREVEKTRSERDTQYRLRYEWDEANEERLSTLSRNQRPMNPHIHDYDTADKLYDEAVSALHDFDSVEWHC